MDKFVILYTNNLNQHYVLCRRFLDVYRCVDSFEAVRSTYNGVGRSINSDAIIFDTVNEALQFIDLHRLEGDCKVFSYSQYNYITLKEAELPMH